MVDVVVAIQGLKEDLNNYDVLGPHLMLEIENEMKSVLIHGDPRIVVEGQKIYKNFDVLITCKTAIDSGWNNCIQFTEVLEPHELVTKRRYDKTTQQLKLSKLARKLELDSFVHIDTFTGTDDIPSNLGELRSVVVKPLHGARGVGHFVVNLDKCSITHVFTAIIKLTKPETDKDKVIADLKELDVHYYPGNENNKYEGLEVYEDQGAAIQELIHWPKCTEYRLIKLADGQLYGGFQFLLYPRTFSVNDGNYKQALGGGIGRNRPLKPPQVKIHKKTLSQVALLIDGIDTLNSVDLCVNDDTGQFCIYEYCPQFGMNGLTQNDSFNIHLEELRNIVTKYLDAVK